VSDAESRGSPQDDEQRRAIDRASDAEGYLIDQRRLAAIPFGRRTSDYNGCGWIAVYNALKSAGEQPNAAEIVRELESGSLLRGRAGVAPWRIVRLLRRRGLRLRFGFRRKTIERLAPGGKAGILLYLRRRLSDGAHYVSFRPCTGGGGSLLCFYNVDGSAQDVRPIAALFSAERPLAALLISIEGP